MMNDTKFSDRDCLKFYPDFLYSMLKRSGLAEAKVQEAKEILEPVFAALLEDESSGGLCTSLERIQQKYIDKKGVLDLSGNSQIGLTDLKKLKDFGLASDANTEEDLGKFPLVLDLDEASPLSSRVYLTRSFLAEDSLAKTIRRLCSISRISTPAEIEKMQKLLSTVPAETEEQKKSRAERQEAMSLVLESNFSVVCGGPGTGKTTAVAGILECLLSENPALNIKLAAPTGKAAIRMLESITKTVEAHPDQYPILLGCKSKLESQTLHRLLYTIQPETGEKPSTRAPLIADVLVIDETSMIGTLFAKKLFDVLSETTRVILMGDADQLSAVEPGSAFADLCTVGTSESLGKKFAARLSVSWRFNDKSVFGQLAQAINAGNAEKALQILKSQGEDSRLKVHWGSPNATSLSEDAKTWMKESLTPYIQAVVQYTKAFEINPENANPAELWKNLPSFRALAASRQDVEGVYALNTFAEFCRKELLNDAFGGSVWEETYGADLGKLLLVTRNDVTLDVYNGDIGIVLPRTGNGNPQMYIGDREKTIYLGQLSNLEPAFALTIHKSQGSEFSRIAVFLPKDETSPLLTRELLYTALTRVKDSSRHPGQIDLFITEAAFRKAIIEKNNRNSGLQSRLRG